VGGAQRGEMTQTLYAHMNNKIKKINIRGGWVLSIEELPSIFCNFKSKITSKQKVKGWTCGSSGTAPA
jgi:hypothetical protein